MATALEIAEATVARNYVSDYVRNGQSYCQTFAGNFWQTFFGRDTPNSYASAAAAYRASTIVSKDYNAAPPGAYHYFTYGSAGHVGVSLGSGLMASGTGWGTKAIRHLGKHVYIHRVADYAAHLPYLGWSYTNGNRARITGLTDASAPSGPDVRTVKSNANAFRRISPASGAALTPKDNRLAAGSSHRITAAYLTGVDINQNGTKTDIWFEVEAYGWAWAGGFTSQSLAGIARVTDARPKPPVEPEVPVEPEQPTEPETPEEPDVPVEPTEPEVPDTPEEPDIPEEPDVPEEPEQPTGSKGGLIGGIVAFVVIVIGALAAWLGVGT